MKEIIDIPIIHSSETFYSKKQSELLKLKRGEIIGIVCRKIRHVLVNLEPGRKIPVHIEELLDKVCSENPLDPKINNKNMELVELKLKDPTREIKCKPMIYTKQDRDEFAEDIKQMCEKGLIRPSKSKHSAPAFYIENQKNEKIQSKRKYYILWKIVIF